MEGWGGVGNGYEKGDDHEGVDLGCGLKGRSTGRNEVLKPNCYIVAGLLYNII